MPKAAEIASYDSLYDQVKQVLNNGADEVQIPIENTPGYSDEPDNVRVALRKRARKNNDPFKTERFRGDGIDTVIIYK